MSALDGTGSQFTELPPRGPNRPNEYPVNYGYFLRDPRARVTQMGFEVVATFTPVARVTQFGLEVVVALYPAGTQLSGNTPPGRPRSTDYTFVESTSTPLAAFLTPLNPGDTSVASTPLPPKAPSRSVDYSWFNPLLPQLAGQDTLLPDHSTAATELPTPGAPRARDYSFTASFFHGLDGQDTMVVGDQLSGNAPPGKPRASTLTDPGTNAVIYITAPIPTVPVGQSTASTELTPRGPARSRDYTWLQSLRPYLIGKDAFNPGVQVFDLPPRAPLRARDYTWLYTLPDQFPPSAPRLPPGGQLISVEPRAPSRIRGDYPSVARAALPLLLTPATAAEQFQAVLII